MQIKPKTKSSTGKTFQWGISTTTIDFMRSSELQTARESSNDCGCGISPLPQHKPKTARRAKG
jgi:hypothetical protein